MNDERKKKKGEKIKYELEESCVLCKTNEEAKDQRSGF